MKLFSTQHIICVTRFFTLLMATSIYAEQKLFIQSVNGKHSVEQDEVWLSHEHTLVDFVGADKIQPEQWDHADILEQMRPYFQQLEELDIDYFVDATPMHIGRDVRLLEKISAKTGLRIITNTGLYGARNKLYVPDKAKKQSAQELADQWISEFENGIDGTKIKPGFIKIGVDAADPLHEIDERLVRAAALTHLQTGLTIASHTGGAVGLWPQLTILKEMNVSPSAFIWVHAHFEANNEQYLKAAKEGVWISLDGLGWEIYSHVDKLVFAKEHGILNRILISHDAGWYDPQKEVQQIKPYTDMFTKLFPRLRAKGFTEEELHQLVSINPARAFAIKVESE